MRIRHGAMAAIIVLSLAGCSGGSEPAADSPTTIESGSETTSAVTEGETAPETAPEPEPALEQPQVFELIATEPTAAGPRPLLAWASVEGAVAYDLIVLDTQGAPYWAWSGEATSVHLGGVENPDAVGAWVFEPLTWIVTARDAEGQPLAMSATAPLEP